MAHREEFRNCEFHFVTPQFLGTPGRNCFVYENIEANSKQLMDLYNAADLFVLPTRADFAPTNAICEAMAMSLPVISTSVGGLDEIVQHGETGIIVPVGEEASLAAAMNTLIANNDLRLKLGRNARKLVEEKFNLQKNIETILDCMKSAAQKKNSTK
jgi:glycosyltransferase involved in cell wall biosynthesis